jgi:cystathionine beta-synthase
LAGAVKGYPVVITLPEKMSNEKVNVLKGLGATVIRTPTEAAWDSPESLISVAKRMNEENKNSIILNQYSNPNNPLAHYEGTALELWESCEGKLDMVVIGAGTGGTISGVAKKLKELNPNIIVVGVDPYGSILAGSTAKDNQPYLVEGLGYDFLPDVLDFSQVDWWVRTEDKESFLMARRLIKQEGLLCGGSSGSAMVAVVKAVKHFNLGRGKRVAVILPDSVRNYISKFLSDDWMLIKGFIQPEDLSKQSIDQNKLASELICYKDTVNVPKSTKISDLTSSHVVTVDDQNNACGVMSAEKWAQKMSDAGLAALKDEPVSKIISVDFGIINEDLPLAYAFRYLQTPFPVLLKSKSGELKIVDKYGSIAKFM